MTTATRNPAKPKSRKGGKDRKPRTAGNDQTRNDQTRTPRQRVEEAIADRIIQLLDAGGLPPWEKDWSDSAHGLPLNAVSMKPYRGVNRWMTLLTQQLVGYKDPRWLTFRQAQALGGHVRKGEESTTVVFWKRVPARQAAREMEEGEVITLTGQEENRTYPMLRAYHVFNVEQTQECRLRELPETELADHDPIEAALAIVAGMPDPPAIEHYLHSNQAPHYEPARDTVRAPEMGRYRTPEGYYNTVFHELVHSTGHEKRLHRFEQDANAHDLHAYGREELVAGMGSAMLAAHAGIGTEVVERDASYIRHWRDAIQGDKPMVIRASTLAQRAVDHILDIPAPTFQPEQPQPEQPAPPES